MRFTLIWGFALALALCWPLNTYGVVNIIKCDSSDTLKVYNYFHNLVKKDASDSSAIYTLGTIAVCMGKEEEGLSHIQTAANLGHVVANRLLGMYYASNKTFDRSQDSDEQEEFDAVIYYYDRAAQLIESLPNYPQDATVDIRDSLEYDNVVSYRIFTTLPDLYLNGYGRAIMDTLNNPERVSYTDTLEVLHKMREASMRCLKRPALSAWKEKRERVYEAQQIKCGASLEFAETVLPLEQQRLQVEKNCVVHPSQCPEHQEIMNTLIKARGKMFEQKASAPRP